MKTALLVLAFACDAVLCFGRVFGSKNVNSPEDQAGSLALSSYGSPNNLDTVLDGLLVLPKGSGASYSDRE